VALAALSRPFVVEVVAGNAQTVCGFLSPTFDLADLCGMTLVAVVFDSLLMFVVLEGEHHYPHLQVDHRGSIRGGFGVNRGANANRKDEQNHSKNLLHNEDPP